MTTQENLLDLPIKIIKLSRQAVENMGKLLQMTAEERTKQVKEQATEAFNQVFRGGRKSTLGLKVDAAENQIASS